MKSSLGLFPEIRKSVKNLPLFQIPSLNYVNMKPFFRLTSPLLLVAIAVCLGACYIINLKNRETKVSVLGMYTATSELSLTKQTLFSDEVTGFDLNLIHVLVKNVLWLLSLRVQKAGTFCKNLFDVKS